MTTKKMTRQQEHDFYANPNNQTPQGPARWPTRRGHPGLALARNGSGLTAVQPTRISSFIQSVTPSRIGPSDWSTRYGTPAIIASRPAPSRAASPALRARGLLGIARS